MQDNNTLLDVTAQAVANDSIGEVVELPEDVAAREAAPTSVVEIDLPDDFDMGTHDKTYIDHGTVFLQVVAYWRERGFTVIPGTISKAPIVKFAEYCGPEGKIPTQAQYEEWAKNKGVTPLLLTCSGRDYSLIVVDIDRNIPVNLPYLTAQFGETPLHIGTGREGGGVHLYFRGPKGGVPQANCLIGDPSDTQWTVDSDGKPIPGQWGKAGVDVKSRHNYVVAPGAVHKSGRQYKSLNTALENISKADIDALPALDVEKLNTLISEAKQRRLEKKGLITRDSAGNVVETDTYVTVARDTLKQEPFFQWCELNPAEVNLATWWGLASNLYAAHGEEKGRAEFHRISQVDSRYDATQAAAQWERAVDAAKKGGKPTSYRKLISEGYHGDIPRGCKCPADFYKKDRPDFPVVMGKGQVSVEIANTKALFDFMSAKFTHDEMRHTIACSLNGADTGGVTIMEYLLTCGQTFGYRPTERNLEIHRNVLARQNSSHPVLHRLSAQGSVDLVKGRDGLKALLEPTWTPPAQLLDPEVDGKLPLLDGSILGPTFRAALQTLRLHIDGVPTPVSPFYPLSRIRPDGMAEPILGQDRGGWTSPMILAARAAHGGAAFDTYLWHAIQAPLIRFFVAAVNALVPRANGRYGIKAENVLVLVGDQGAGKTMWLNRLWPDDDGVVLTGASLDPSDKDSVIHVTKSWICELGEVDATFRKSDIAQLKAFLSKTTDRYRAPYAREEEEHPRRTVFCASVNDPEFLVDRTGNRRFWPISIASADFRALEKLDRIQLWREVAWYAWHARAEHTRWWPEGYYDQTNLAAEAAKYQQAGTWDMAIEDHLRPLRTGERGLTRVEVIAHLQISGGFKDISPRDRKEIFAILRRAYGEYKSNGYWFIKCAKNDPLADAEAANNDQIQAAVDAV